jgi:hypothetical protein
MWFPAVKMASLSNSSPYQIANLLSTSFFEKALATITDSRVLIQVRGHFNLKTKEKKEKKKGFFLPINSQQ